MLKFLKGLLLALAAAALIATVVLLVNGWIQIDRLWAVATAQKNQNMYPNPRNLMLITTGAALLTGLLAGFGLGVPKQTFKQQYEVKQREAAAQYQASLAKNVEPTPADEPVVVAPEPVEEIAAAERPALDAPDADVPDTDLPDPDAPGPDAPEGDQR